MTPGATVDSASRRKGANSATAERPLGTLDGKNDRIGLFGCSGAGGRLVRVGWRGRKGRKAPTALTIDCPVCGRCHPAKPLWRRFTDDDRKQGLDVVVDPADLPVDPLDTEDEIAVLTDEDEAP